MDAGAVGGAFVLDYPLRVLPGLLVVATAFVPLGRPAPVLRIVLLLAFDRGCRSSWAPSPRGSLARGCGTGTRCRRAPSRTAR